MAFGHKAGTASSIADWFSTFEDWVTNTLGWTVESGICTQGQGIPLPQDRRNETRHMPGRIKSGRRNKNASRNPN